VWYYSGFPGLAGTPTVELVIVYSFVHFSGHNFEAFLSFTRLARRVDRTRRYHAGGS
jgi:hypothetical protein